jgi:hypothetical protein
MVQPREDVTLRSGRAERFQRIKSQVEERRGHEVEQTAVMDELMDSWEDGHTDTSE